MIILLLITLSAVGISGYMIGMDRYFGQTWVEDLHEVFVNFLIVLVIGHVGGVIFSSRRHHENLVKSMVTGKKETTIDEPKHPTINSNCAKSCSCPLSFCKSAAD